MLETRLFWWISKMACWPLVGMASTPTWAHVINMDGLGCMGGSSCVKPEKVSSKSFQNMFDAKPSWWISKHSRLVLALLRSNESCGQDQGFEFFFPKSVSQMGWNLKQIDPNPFETCLSPDQHSKFQKFASWPLGEMGCNSITCSGQALGTLWAWMQEQIWMKPEKVCFWSFSNMLGANLLQWISKMVSGSWAGEPLLFPEAS